jgi:hypothetical protein
MERIESMDRMVRNGAELEIERAVNAAFNNLVADLSNLRPKCAGYSPSGCHAQDIMCGLAPVASADASRRQNEVHADYAISVIKTKIIDAWKGPAGSRAVENFIQRVDELGGEVEELRNSVQQVI